MSKKEKKNGSELGRRELLKLGVLAGAAVVITSKKSRAQTRDTRDSWNINGVQSPPTTPFIVPLTIPPAAQPVAQLNPAPSEFPVAGEAFRAPHQRWNEFQPQKLYEIRQRQAPHSFHPELPTQNIWGFDGITPGPTFYARYGEPIVVRNHNNLPADHVGYGIPSIITHLHNGHTPSESDGFPGDFYEVGEFKDHRYPNVLAGYDAFPATKGDPREAMGTLWYHDHRVDFTAPNSYKGLAGFYLLFDDKDSGNENDTNPAAFRLPSGQYDVPLMFSDKVFDANGQLFFDQFNMDGIIGDKFLVNGKIQPYFKVARRKYRFRLLDSGPSRFYEFFLSNGQPFTQISNDGNLLPAPLSVQSIRLSVAERKDVIIDFSKAQIGDRIFLENRLSQTDGQGPDGLVSQSEATQILRFDVDRDAPDPSRIPTALRTLPPVNLNEVVKTRTWVFDQQNGVWVVNNRIYNVNRVDATVKRGTAEKWIIKNGTRRWHHPIHIHFEEFQILSRGRNPPSVQEKSRKDVMELQPFEQIEIFMRFRDFTGRYVMHCHNTIHEDHAMMVRFDIVP